MAGRHVIQLGLVAFLVAFCATSGFSERRSASGIINRIRAEFGFSLSIPHEDGLNGIFKRSSRALLSVPLDKIGGGIVLRELDEEGPLGLTLHHSRSLNDDIKKHKANNRKHEINKRSDDFDSYGHKSLGEKNFDEIDRLGFRNMGKRNFDEIDRAGFGGMGKRNFDEIDNSGFRSMGKRNFDEIDRAEFGGMRKRNFDEIDKSGFRNMRKRNFDKIDRALFDGMGKRNFDEIDRAGFRSMGKKNLDRIDRTGFDGMRRRNFDQIDEVGFEEMGEQSFKDIDKTGFGGMRKRNFDEIDRSGFGGMGKRNFDEIDRAGFGGMGKRNFDEIDRVGFGGMGKRNFDEIDKIGFHNMGRRNFDEIDRASFHKIGRRNFDYKVGSNGIETPHFSDISKFNAFRINNIQNNNNRSQIKHFGMDEDIIFGKSDEFNLPTFVKKNDRYSINGMGKENFGTSGFSSIGKQNLNEIDRYSFIPIGKRNTQVTFEHGTDKGGRSNPSKRREFESHNLRRATKESEGFQIKTDKPKALSSNKDGY